MSPIPIKEAVERLAKAIATATPDDLGQIYTELHPLDPVPVVSGAQAEQLAKQLVAEVLAGIGPDEVVDLWNVVFTEDRMVYYDEEDDVLRQRERRLRYTEL